MVEDEPDLADTLCFALKKEGYDVSHAATGSAALKELSSLPDIILLDLMLPDISGKDIARHVRSLPGGDSVFIIMLTAKSEERDRVIGFEVGADDYVTKPFSIRELLLRIKAILRRQNQEKTAPSEQIVLGPFTIDLVAHRALLDGEELVLTALEFKLLQTFLKREGAVQSRDRLLEDVWNMDPNVNTRTVDKHVQRLRQKLGVHSNVIETIRSIGYRFSVRA